MARAPRNSKESKAAPLDPAVVKLIDALARFLAREDDACNRSAIRPALFEREAIDDR